MRASSGNGRVRRLIVPALFILICGAISAADDATAATIASLEAAGGQFKKNKEGVLSEVFFKDASAITPEMWKQINTLTTLRKGTFYKQATLNDETLPLLSGLVNLEEFAVDGAHLTDKGMQAFAQWKNLKRMTFFHVFWGAQNFNGSGLDVFAQLPNLEHFSMGGSTLTDAGLEALSKVTQLKEIRIWHTGVTDAGTVHLKKLTNLKKLHLAGQFNTKLTDGMVAGVAAIPSIEKLTLGETRLSYDGGLKELKAMAGLKELEFDKVDVSDADVAKVKADLPNVTIKHTRPNEKEMENLEKAFKKK